MNVRKAFCFFEQSGTFKREFVRLGVPAEDYDIRNDFGETDHVIDLFSEIRGGIAAIRRFSTRSARTTSLSRFFRAYGLTIKYSCSLPEIIAL